MTENQYENFMEELLEFAVRRWFSSNGPQIDCDDWNKLENMLDEFFIEQHPEDFDKEEE